VQVEQVVPDEVLSELAALRQSLAAAQEEAVARHQSQNALEQEVSMLKERLSEEQAKTQVAGHREVELKAQIVALNAQVDELASSNNLTEMMEKNRLLMYVYGMPSIAAHPFVGPMQ
jgi:chromosome segregation ATPase